MSMPSPSGDRGPLERLCGDEAELERELSSARRAAAEVLTSAREEAERVAAAVRAELTRELARLRAESEEAVRLASERAETLADEESAAVARRADRNRPRALAFLLEAVLGRGSP